MEILLPEQNTMNIITLSGVQNGSHRSSIGLTMSPPRSWLTMTAAKRRHKVTNMWVFGHSRSRNFGVPRPRCLHTPIAVDLQSVILGVLKLLFPDADSVAMLVNSLLKHPTECGLVDHIWTHSVGCRGSHSVSLRSPEANKTNGQNNVVTYVIGKIA